MDWMRLIADGLTLLGLAAMASFARSAWRRLPADARIPMQWSLSGKVLWRAPKAIGLLSLPVIATIVLFVLMASARMFGPMAVPDALILFLARLGILGGLISGQLMQINSVLRDTYRAPPETPAP